MKYMKDETMPVTKEVAQELKAALTEDDGAKKTDGGAENAANEQEKK